MPLCQIKKYHISNISLKDIEQKVLSQGDNYKLGDLETDISNFFLAIYKESAKNSSDYRQASDLENYFLSLMKIERGDSKKGDPLKGQGGRKKNLPIRTYQPLSSYKTATPL